MTAPTVLILYNEPALPLDHPDSDSETDILYTVDVIASSLRERGIIVRRLGVADDTDALLEGMRRQSPDVVFNLYEGLATWGQSEAYVAALLEWLRIPFTGSPSFPLMLCRSKPLTKQLLSGAGLPTARFAVVGSMAELASRLRDGLSLNWPLIVKPSEEDGSVGITQESVVTQERQLRDRVDFVLTTYGGSALIEEFIHGREFHVSVWEHDGRIDVLPFSEITFTGDESRGEWPIISFDAKWRPGTADYQHTPATNPADVDSQLQDRISEVVRRAFRVTGCRDYARLDVRVDRQGCPLILEVNPNPCIGPMGGFEAALQSAKIPYNEFTSGLVFAAIARGNCGRLSEVRLRMSQGESAHALSSSLLVRATSEPPAVSQVSERVQSPVVRLARSRDRGRLQQLVQSVPDISSHDKAIMIQRLETLRWRKRPPGFAVFVSTAGLAIVDRCESLTNVAKLRGLYVAKEARHQGHGKALLRAAEEFAKSSGARLLVCELSGGISGAMLRPFLTHYGYLQMSDIPDYYPDSSSLVSFVRYFPSLEASAISNAVPSTTNSVNQS